MATPKELARTCARLALGGIGREWPHSYQHLANGRRDVRPPRELHPAFYGCYDWHSAVHSHWALARLLRRCPGLGGARRIRRALDRNLSARNLAREAAYFRAPGRFAFERPYGWAWLLTLAAELRAWDDPDARRWAKNVRPLEKWIAERFIGFIRRLPYPVRTGVHSNTAFGMALAFDYARAVRNQRLVLAIAGRARDYFSADRNAPAAWEPGGADFLSPTLVEADLMRRVLGPADFGPWLRAFLPGLARGKPAAVLRPPMVLDRKDPQQVHLDGLCLSRAWAIRGIAGALPASDPSRRVLLAAAKRHASAGLARVASGDYIGEHWLGSFAVYLTTADQAAPVGRLSGAFLRSKVFPRE